MSLILPPSKNYGGTIAAIPSAVMKEPGEGRKSIPIQIAWSDYASDYCVAINLQNRQTLNFSQVVALSIDNSRCGAPVVFVFPDTQETTTIPAYSPKTIIEVFTGQTQFNVVGNGVSPSDVTFFSILNFLPPPVSVSVSQEQNIAAVTAIPGTVANVNVIPATFAVGGITYDNNGTLENVAIFGSAHDAGSYRHTWTLQDGSATPRVIATGRVESGGGEKDNWQLLNLSGVHVRFLKGVFFNLTETGGGGNVDFSVNLYYRTP